MSSATPLLTAPTSSSSLSLTTKHENDDTNNNTNNNNNNNNINNNKKQGCLVVTILSIYDLPRRDPPDAVVLTVLPQQQQPQYDNNDDNHHALALTATSGPPSARHKDKNSFKFSQQNVLEIVAPLEQLYNTHATLTLEYNNNNSISNNIKNLNSPQQLQARIQLSTLKIHESNWLILNLEPTTKEQEQQQQQVTSLASPPSQLKTDPTSTTTTTALTTTTTTNKMDQSSSSSSSSSSQAPPTIRLQVQLLGPYRAEIAFCVYILQTWFGLVDPLERHVVEHVAPVVLPQVTGFFQWTSNATTTNNNNNNNNNNIIIPIVAVLLMLTFPVWVWTTPILLPFVLVLAVSGGVVVTTGLVLYLSSSQGRDQLGGCFLSPLANTLLSTPSGQRLVYQTGPRPTPVSVCRTILNNTTSGGGVDNMWHMLALSLVIDAVGSSSYLLPILGEGFDVAWAPIQTILLMAMYDNNNKVPTNNNRNNNNNRTTTPSSTSSSSTTTAITTTVFPSWSGLKYLSFLEEILPFTDLVPSATIGWWIKFGPTLLRQWKLEDVSNNNNNNNNNPAHHHHLLALLFGQQNKDNNSSSNTSDVKTTSSSSASASHLITPFNTPLSSAHY